MYSSLHPKRDTFTTYQIFVEGKKVKTNQLWDAQRAMVLGTIAFYDKLQQQPYYNRLSPITHKRLLQLVFSEKMETAMPELTNDSLEIARYRLWLLHYLADMRLVKSADITVLKTVVGNARDTSFFAFSNDTLFTAHE